MIDKIKFINHEVDLAVRNHSIPTLVFAGIAHLYFEILHPFEDGNGRIGRALVEKALSQRNGKPSLNSLSKTISNNKKAYYSALQKCNTTLEITSWLIYFCQTVIEAQNYTFDLMNFVVSKNKFPDGLGYIAVGSHSPSDTSETNILLVSLDKDGCIEGHSCEDEFIIVSTDEVIDLTDYKDKMSIYPNPTSDRFTIKATTFDKSYKITITDIAGKTWWAGDYVEEMSFAADEYNNGMYFVHLINDLGQIVHTEKLVIIK